MGKSSIIFIALLLIGNQLHSQVSINTDGSQPDPSAGVEVKFNNRGILPPRMTNAEMSTIANPANGLMVYCTDCGATGTGAMMMFKGGSWIAMNVNCINPATPFAGTNVPSLTQIIWNWNPVAGANGYKWNTINNYSTAIDMISATAMTETGLTCGKPYTRYVWAYNGCGFSTPISLFQMTSACPFVCDSSFTIFHMTSGGVAPVSKLVTYGTVTNIPGATTKCWITSNLGADHQATAVSDATETSAGWYWQFNRKQGYKLADDGTTRTPNTTWIYPISETSDWITANDPCNIELGTTWRLPTYTEWYNVDNTGGWTTWTGPWGSGLKLHAAGGLDANYGSLYGSRGLAGQYWSSTQGGPTGSSYLSFSINHSYADYLNKAFGMSVRCVRDF